jgi:hypothetical protein
MRPQAIVIEATVPLTSRPGHYECEPGVLAAGMKSSLFGGLNRFYARDDEPELGESCRCRSTTSRIGGRCGWASEFKGSARPPRAPVGLGGCRASGR